jgi:hypothetical protein
MAEGAMITVHPSFLLRMPDRDVQQREYARLVEELTTAREFAA